MVSNARLDFPDPESPVTTVRRSRGSSTEMFFRLCTRAPCTAIVVRASAFAFLPAEGARLPLIRGLAEMEEGELLHLEVAPPGQLHRHARFADQALIGEVLTRRGHVRHVVVPLEVVFDLRARPGLPGFAQ